MAWAGVLVRLAPWTYAVTAAEGLMTRVLAARCSVFWAVAAKRDLVTVLAASADADRAAGWAGLPRDLRLEPQVAATVVAAAVTLGASPAGMGWGCGAALGALLWQAEWVCGVAAQAALAVSVFALGPGSRQQQATEAEPR